MKFLPLALLAVLAFGAPAALAQAGPPAPGPTSILAGQVSLNANATSSNVALPSTAAFAYAVTIYNEGTVDAHVAFGTSNSAVATLSSTDIPPGHFLTIWSGANTYLAAITASDSALLLIYQGNGPVNFGS